VNFVSKIKSKKIFEKSVYGGKIQANYRIVASEIDLTELFKDFEVDVEAKVTDYEEGSSGGWHEPASAAGGVVNVSGISIETKEMVDDAADLLAILRGLKAGDTVKANYSGTAEIPSNKGREEDEGDVDFTLGNFHVKKVTWAGTKCDIECDEDIDFSGHTPTQSYKGWQREI